MLTLRNKTRPHTNAQGRTGRVDTRFHIALLSGVWILVLATMPVAAAETADAQAEPEALSEITVTAQRREQKLSKVPVSVVAFGADALVSRNIVSEQDMGTLVPGLQVKNGQNSNQLSFSMRR